jgi:hypothetical protein
LILLDENTLRSQLELLEARRLPVRKVGWSWGRDSMSDDDILAKLKATRVQPTGIVYWERNASREVEQALS